MDRVTVRELRNHGGRVLERVMRGETLTVTLDDGGTVPARLVAADPIFDIAVQAAGHIERGGTVFVHCDAGISRSVVVSAMIIALLEDGPMDESLWNRVCGFFPPNPVLWEKAKETLKRHAYL